MYNNPYFSGTYNPQASIDRINNQIAELESMKKQIPQAPVTPPTNLTQNFQIAPNNNSVIRYAGSIEEVQKDIVIGDTPFFSKDMSILWIKNTKGDVKTYELNEIVPKDEKDLQIEFLQAQIEELKKGMIINESNAVIDEPVAEPVKSKKSTSAPAVRTTKAKSK